MGYIPTEWQTGDVITAEKLNNIENGVASVGSGTLCVGLTGEHIDTLSETWQTINDAMESGKIVFITYALPEFLGGGIVTTIVYKAELSDGLYIVSAKDLTSAITVTYQTDSASGYPVVSNG